MPAVHRAPARTPVGTLRRGLAVGFAIVLALLALTFKPAVQNDGVGYFAYLPAVLGHHDLDLSAVYSALPAARITYYPPLYQVRGPSGHLVDFFPVGPALLAAPAYLAVLLGGRGGGDPFGPPYSWAFTLASLMYGLLALLVSFRLAALIAGRPAAWVGVAGAALATPFVYYLVYDPSVSHTFSAFAVSAFLLVWWHWRDRRSAAGWAALGLLGGLMGLVRFEDGPLLLIALLDRPRRPWHLLLFAAGAAVAFSPQLLADQYFFGTWLPQRPAGEALQPFPGHYLQVLFSSNHGVFIWAPILALAVAGFAFVADRRLQLAFGLAFLLELAIVGAAPDWNGDFAFGPRRFVALTPFFAIGLAALAARAGTRRAAWLFAALVAWNLVLIANFTYVIRGSVDTGYWGLLVRQLAALAYLPHLLSQGAVGRMLLFWPFLHLGFDPIAGLVLLAGQALCLGVVVLLLRRTEAART